MGLLYQKRRLKVNKIKRILKADKIFTEKFDEIKELFEEANQTNSSNK